jgi:hypothetical protein
VGSVSTFQKHRGIRAGSAERVGTQYACDPLGSLGCRTPHRVERAALTAESFRHRSPMGGTRFVRGLVRRGVGASWSVGETRSRPLAHGKTSTWSSQSSIADDMTEQILFYSFQHDVRH